MVLDDSPVGREDEEDEEEKLFKQAIALSLEGAEENDTEEEGNNEQHVQDAQEDGEEEEEYLMLRRAIALSLEGGTENDQKKHFWMSQHEPVKAIVK